MRSVRIALSAAIALAAFTACDDPTDVPFDDVAVTQDIAASSGDAAADMVAAMINNETTAGGGAELAGPSTASGPTVARPNRVCLDVNGATVANCLPFSSVRKIITSVTMSGSRTSTRTNAQGQTVTWTGTVDRTQNDTVTRNFTAGTSTEVSRTHSGNGVAHDATTFTDGSFTREVHESARDSVKNVVFNLPRNSNPWPVSGSIVRADTVHVAITKDNKSVSRDAVHRVEVIFPADAQGNVALKVDAKTCQLNLVTHAVTNCVSVTL